MSNTFQETTVLECNRLSSEEGKASSNDNPALFTNKIGSGVKLNAGDTISVQSAFISELGAGNETIQFSGKTLTDAFGNALKINLSHTTISKSNACFQDPINNASNNQNQVKLGVPLTEKATTISTAYILKDNEINLKISYYKTRNGDCCLSLPRRYLSNIAQEFNTRPAQWNIEDSVSFGLPFKGQSLQNGGVLVLKQATLNGVVSPINRSYFVDEDYIFKKGSGQKGGTPNTITNSFWKLKSDNSRYKIFVNGDSVGVNFPGAKVLAGDQAWFPYADVSESYYIPYEEILTLTAPVGFSSPESIADSLTNQLRETGALETPYYNEWSACGTEQRVRLQRPVSVNTKTPTYKTFNSFSVNNHNASSYFAFYSSTFNASDKQFLYSQYIQNYQYIGIKRPDFYEKGKELIATMTEGGGGIYNKFSRLNLDINTSATTPNGRLNASIQIDHEWTKANLDAWKGWLDTQGNYPELFTNRNNNYSGITSVDNSRFCHMNLNVSQQARLGGDNVVPDSFGANEVANLNASSQNSVPLFFDFDPSASNTFTDGDATNPCYGFAFKTKSANPNRPYVITFSTTKIGTGSPFHNNTEQTTQGVPYEYAHYSGSANASGYKEGIIVGNYQASGTNPLNNASGTLIGFDKHFNSYGNAVIGLQDGYLNNDYQFMTHYAVNTLSDNSRTLGNAIIDATPFAEKIYLGAQEPKFEYSASNQKFNISQLHTPEYIGNLWNAGIVAEKLANNTPENPQAQQKVFHINKRINNTNWTTDMIPYSQNYASDIPSATPNVGTDDGSYTISTMNECISPWTIFDTQSGIFIEDFGFPEYAWNRSLWDILGFTYKQFNSQINSSFNYNTRINEINKKSMPIATTNADVNAGDTINFMTNIFGAVLLTPQVPLPMLFNGTTGSKSTPPFVNNRFPQSFPAITEDQRSILLEADNLPTKMIRAYYTVRSSLLDNFTYLGSKDSGQGLKTIGIVNKINGEGNFYFQQENNLIFTITQPKTITSITTSIHEPDGSFAQINRDSCIIYKLNQTINSTLNPLAELLQATNKK